MDDGKVIYCKRYDDYWKKEREEIEQLLAQLKLEAKEQTEEEAPERTLRYIPIPGKAEQKQRFIDLAIRFSEQLRVNADIVEYVDCVDCDFAGRPVEYRGEDKKLLTELTALSDAVSVWAGDSPDGEYSLSFAFYTHELVFGRK